MLSGKRRRRWGRRRKDVLVELWREGLAKVGLAAFDVLLAVVSVAQLKRLAFFALVVGYHWRVHHPEGLARAPVESHAWADTVRFWLRAEARLGRWGVLGSVMRVGEIQPPFTQLLVVWSDESRLVRL